jgi:protein-S-isoprenylcysteine O-methyltransferase Ste14
MMRASEIEFKYRFYWIGTIFGLGFWCYAFDHRNAGVAVAQLLFKGFSLQSPKSLMELRLIFGVGAALSVAAAALRTWAAAYLQSEVVQDRALHSEALVADGPYRYMRNPLYLGGVMLGAGLGLMASRVGWFVMTIGLLIFYYRLIGREEAALIQSQSERFRAFCAAVPRFWPALRPRVASAGMKPRWGQAWAGETFMWGFASGPVLFAITLNIVYTWVGVSCGFAAYFLFRYFVNRRKAQHMAESK